MKRKTIHDPAMIARVRALAEAGETTREIRNQIRAEYEKSISYAQIGEWAHDILEVRRESNSLTTMMLVLFPDGFEFLPVGRRPFATLHRATDRAEPWIVYRSPVMQAGPLRGQRRYTFMTGSGANVVIWAKSLAAWLEALKRGGYRVKSYDPDEQPEQAEMFSERVAA